MRKTIKRTVVAVLLVIALLTAAMAGITVSAGGADPNRVSFPYIWDVRSSDAVIYPDFETFYQNQINEVLEVFSEYESSNIAVNTILSGPGYNGRIEIGVDFNELAKLDTSVSFFDAINTAATFSAIDDNWNGYSFKDSISYSISDTVSPDLRYGVDFNSDTVLNDIGKMYAQKINGNTEKLFPTPLTPTMYYMVESIKDTFNISVQVGAVKDGVTNYDKIDTADNIIKVFDENDKIVYQGNACDITLPVIKNTSYKINASNSRSDLDVNIHLTVNKVASENNINNSKKTETVTDSISKITVAGTFETGTSLSAVKITSGANFILADTALKNDIEKFMLFDINLLKNGAKIQPDGKVTVSIPVPAGYNGVNCKVYRFESDGTKTDMKAKLEKGFLVFETDHFSLYAVAQMKTSAAGGVKSPPTGDNAAALLVCFGVMVLASGMVVVNRKAKKTVK